MRRKFATNLVFLFAANLLVKPFWIFGIDRVVQNRVGPEVYGTYFAVFNYSFLLSIILDFGINNFNNRAVSRNNNRSGEYLLNLLLMKFFLAVLYFFFTFISAWSAGFSELEMKMLFVLALNQILLSAVLYFRSHVAALQFFKTDSILSVADRLLTILFCLLLLYAPFFKNGFSMMWFIYAQTLALFFTAVAAFAVVIGKTGLHAKLWRIKFSQLVLLKSAPFALLALLMGIYYRVDAVMIERMLPNGAHEAGIYAASFRLLDALNQFGFLFATLLLPMFAGMIRKNESVKHLVKFSSELMFAFSATAGVICFFFSTEIMQLLYHSSNAYWAKIFGWLMLNFLPMSSIYVFGTLLTAKGSLKILNLIAFGGMAMNVSLNFFLIPKYGALGATAATLATQLFAALAHILAANKQFAFKYEWKEVIKLLAYMVTCAVVSLAVKQLPMFWMVNFVTATLICFVVAAKAKLVPLNEIWAMFRSKVAS